MPPPPLPANAATTPPPPLTDFGDWLSPMIVKELRQGLRTWLFVGAFIVLQAILVMTLLISSSAGNVEAASYLFWMLIAGILVFIVPLRGFAALSAEIKSETLDLLMLTRLGAFRIAVGKWIAVVAQTTLITISVLPYVVLRYFGGGVDLVHELLALLLLWMLSAAVAAVGVAISALPSIILRTLVLLATWFWAMMTSNAIIAFTVAQSSRGFFFFASGGAEHLWTVLAVLTPLWAYGCYMVLDVGATAIAPLAANHATRKRLVSLVLMLVAFAFVLFWSDRDGSTIAFSCLAAIGAIAALDCLSESPTASPTVYAPFVVRGMAGRLAAGLLAPGWVTGLAFYASIAALVWIAFSSLDAWRSSGISVVRWDSQEKLILINALLTPIVPLALAIRFFRNSQRLLGPYLVCAIAILVASLLLLIMSGLSREESVGFLGMLTPPSALILQGAMNSQATEIAVLTGGMVTGLALLLSLIPSALTVIRAQRQVIALAAEPPPAAAHDH